MKIFILILLSFCIIATAETEYAEPKPSMDNPRQIMFSIKSGGDEEIHHVLSTANNVLKFYGPENVEMKIIAYYHGIRALLKKNKKIALRVEALMMYDVEFVACGNAMRTKKIEEDELIDGSEIVTTGVAEIVERTKEGWTYVVP